MPTQTLKVPKGGTRSLAQWKQFFFDRQAVIDAIGKGKAAALRRFGGYLATVAKRSMRYRKGASAPGQPPSAHKDANLARKKKLGFSKHNGALLREFLYYAFDPTTESVVVGPQGFRTKGGGMTVPQLHEYGGTVPANGRLMVVKNKPGRDVKGRFVSAGERIIRLTGSIRYPKRPYMAPALKVTRGNFAKQFKSIIRG